MSVHFCDFLCVYDPFLESFVANVSSQPGLFLLPSILGLVHLYFIIWWGLEWNKSLLICIPPRKALYVRSDPSENTFPHYIRTLLGLSVLQFATGSVNNWDNRKPFLKWQKALEAFGLKDMKLNPWEFMMCRRFSHLSSSLPHEVSICSFETCTKKNIQQHCHLHLAAYQLVPWYGPQGESLIWMVRKPLLFRIWEWGKWSQKMFYRMVREEREKHPKYSWPA